MNSPGLKLKNKHRSKLRKLTKNFTGTYVNKLIRSKYPKMYKRINNNKALTSQQWFDLINGRTNCLGCNKPTNFISFRKGYGKFCGRGKFACKAGQKLQRDNFKTAFTEKYGVDNPSKVRAIVKTRNKYFMKTYGYKSVFGCKKVQKKIIETNLRKYGMHHSKLEKTKAKGRATCLAKYGVAHPMQDPNIFSKALKKRFKIKTLKVKGKIYHYQGWENLAIKYYLEKGYKVKSHVYKSFKYKHKGKIGRYFPDLFISRNGKKYVVEVKNNWTLGENCLPILNKNIAKFRKVVKVRNFILFVINKRATKFRTYKNKKAIDYALSFR